MHFDSEHVYHLYNRGNNKTQIFFSAKNYLYFLQKIRAEWLAYCDIYCYCLMPNQFHFMLQPNENGCEAIILKQKITHLQNFSKSIGKTLSSYTQAINIQNNTTGNLFQKKTKAKCLTDEPIIESNCLVTDHLLNCFLYIHNNPLKANLTRILESGHIPHGRIIMGLEMAIFAIWQKRSKKSVLVRLIFKTQYFFNPIKTVFRFFYKSVCRRSGLTLCAKFLSLPLKNFQCPSQLRHLTSLIVLKKFL